MKILLIEDDEQIALFIIQGFKQAGHVIDHISDGVTGLDHSLSDMYDVAIIDIMLPGLDGFTIISRMRAEGVDTPVIVLSARDSVEDRVRGLETGGDDYLVKPFAFSELLARVQALHRRSRSIAEPDVHVIGDLTVDLMQRTVVRDGTVIDLQPREFALLAYLVKNKGRVVSKIMILEHVWEYNFFPQTNVVEARISHLRDKIDKPFKTKLIHTVHGVGYTIREHKI